MDFSRKIQKFAIFTYFGFLMTLFNFGVFPENSEFLLFRFFGEFGLSIFCCDVENQQEFTVKLRNH